MISSRSSIVPSSGLCIFASWIFGKCDLPCYCRIDAVTILGDGATAAHWTKRFEVGVKSFREVTAALIGSAADDKANSLIALRV
jgi:hypothetical protein